jgi:hypothetical protein
MPKHSMARSLPIFQTSPNSCRQAHPLDTFGWKAGSDWEPHWSMPVGHSPATSMSIIGPHNEDQEIGGAVHRLKGLEACATAGVDATLVCVKPCLEKCSAKALTTNQGRLVY